MLTAKLIDSVASEDLKATAEYLEDGANPNTVSVDGATAMHIAAGVGADAVRLMLAHGGDPNVRSVDGSTPLHVAAAWGDRDILRLLLHNGANPNIRDHEGQRAVDVARSEEHAACVDFLKYYTMLVMVGDEEESPMYTSELIDPSHMGNPADLRTGSPSHNIQFSNHPAHYYSDEEDPDNLSDQYSDALSRRLSRLLTDGDGACLDVTSPDCPYIGEKQDRGRGSGDRTLLAEDTGTHLPCLSDSDSSDNDAAAFCEGGNHSCRCHSNHCCTHDQPGQVNFGTGRETPMQYFDGPESSAYCDPRTTYARNVEMKMKRKYFPDFGGDIQVSQRDRELGCQSGFAGKVVERCSPKSLNRSRQKKKYVCEDRIGYVSPNAASAVCCTERRSRSGSKGAVDETGCCKVDYSSSVPYALRSSPCSCPHHVRKHSSSPSRGDYQMRYKESNSPSCIKQSDLSFTGSVSRRDVAQKQPCSPKSGKVHCTQRLFHSPTCTGGLQSERGSSPRRCETSHHYSSHQHGACCFDNISRSPNGQGEKLRQSVSHQGLYRSLSDYNQQECHSEGHHHRTVNKPLRKQTTYPPAEKSHFPGCATRSPVIMHVQNERSSPPPGIFQRVHHLPFTPSSPKQDQAGFTSTSSGGKKEVFVAGSCSGHSVDSGFYEKYTSKQHLGADDQRHQPKSSRYRIPKHAAPTAYNERSIQNVWDSEKKVKDCESSHLFDMNTKYDREDLLQSASDKLDSVTTFGDNFNVVSSNLRGSSSKSNPPRQSKHVHSVCEKEDQKRTRKEAPRQEATTADGSDSSSDSFQTCEEASVQENTHDMKSEHKTQRPKPHVYSQRLSDSKKYATVSSQDCAADVKNQEEKLNTASLGFSLSERDENQHNQNTFRKKGVSLLGSFSSTQQETKMPDCKNVGGAARQRGMLPPKNDTDSQCRNHYKAWLPPSVPLPDDSDLLTSDESFMTRTGNQFMKKPSMQSNNVSRWLQNVPLNASHAKLTGAKHGGNRANKRISDESLLSIASSVQEYIYRDKENGIALIERHIPSDFSGSSGRPSLENSVSLDTDATVSYDWSDFSIHSHDASSTSSSFDITAGQTMNSQNTIKAGDSNSCDEDCSSESDDHTEESGNDNKQNDEESEKSTKKKRNSEKAQQMPESDTKKMKNTSSQQTDIQADSGGSDVVSVSPELASLSNEAIYQSLKDLGEDPGPVLPSTRQTYLQLLASLQSGKIRLGLTSSQPGHSSELNRMVSGCLDVEDLAKAELSMVAQFQTPDGRTWREGTVKSCFNYLLLDPRVTKNLPLRARNISDSEAFKIFLSAVFYIGKGKRSRPYCHLYEAISHQNAPKPKVGQKVEKILAIWSAGLGVVSLHCFQNVIPVEAYTREACMVDAMGLAKLTNVKKGDYYGVASTWPAIRRRCMGAYLLRKAFQIFLSEGERQICPLDIQKGK